MFKVWDINWDAVRLFLALATQWRIASVSGPAGGHVFRTGLDYAAIEPTRRALGLPDVKANLFGGLRLLESAALQAFAEASNV